MIKKDNPLNTCKHLNQNCLQKFVTSFDYVNTVKHGKINNVTNSVPYKCFEYMKKNCWSKREQSHNVVLYVFFKIILKYFQVISKRDITLFGSGT